MTPAERGNMDITKELARAVKYYMIMEDAFLNPGNFKEAHKNFVEKMEEYRKKENLTEEEAQYNIEMAVEALKKYGGTIAARQLKRPGTVNGCECPKPL